MSRRKRRILEGARTGDITVITSCMFSGKSWRLLNIIDSARGVGKKVLAVKPSSDERDKGKIVARRLNPVTEEREVFEYDENVYLVDDSNIEELATLIMRTQFDVFAMDEVQFVKDPRFIDLVKDLAWNENNFITGQAPWRRGYAQDEWVGREVVLAGLDLDFMREPFGITPQLLALTPNVEKPPAFCNNCGRHARFTQLKVEKLSDEELLKIDWNNPIVPGDSDIYGASCGDCYVDPKTAAEKRLAKIR